LILTLKPISLCSDVPVIRRAGQDRSARVAVVR